MSLRQERLPKQRPLMAAARCTFTTESATILSGKRKPAWRNVHCTGGDGDYFRSVYSDEYTSVIAPTCPTSQAAARIKASIHPVWVIALRRVIRRATQRHCTGFALNHLLPGGLEVLFCDLLLSFLCALSTPMDRKADANSRTNFYDLRFMARSIIAQMVGWIPPCSCSQVRRLSPR